ncbi:MAG: type II secretion system F family protein [Armatimonadota bacterium]
MDNIKEKKKKKKQVRGIKSLNDTLAVFFKQLSAMISSGVSLHSGLSILMEQSPDYKFRLVLRDIVYNISDEGMALSSAMAQYPEVFPPIYTATLRAGEEGGFFENVLEKIADDLEKENKLRKRFYSLITYPIFMVVASVLCILVILKFIIPAFTPMLKSAGVEMPLSTKILMGTLGIFNNPVTIAVIIILAILFYRFVKTKRGWEVTQNSLLLLPIIGPTMRYMVIIRFSRVFSLLHDTGFPVLKSLELIKDVLNISYYANAMDLVINDMKDGELLSNSLESLQIFPRLMISMIRIGEETGELKLTLQKMTKFYEEEFESILEKFFAILEPALLIFMGCVVGFIVMSVFMPMYQVVSKL